MYFVASERIFALNTYIWFSGTYLIHAASRYVGSLSIILSTRFSSHDLKAELETFDKTVRTVLQAAGAAGLLPFIVHEAHCQQAKAKG